MKKDRDEEREIMRDISTNSLTVFVFKKDVHKL
jgi:hypothetical protein